MKYLKPLSISFGLLIGLGVFAFGQSIIQQNPNGKDAVLVQSGGPGGQGYPTTIQALRNASGYTLATTQTTENTSIPNASATAIALGAITTWNITLPPSPFDGERVEITCPGGTVSTVVVASAVPATTIVGTAYTGCTAGGAATNNAEFSYSTSTNTWYRIN